MKYSAYIGLLFVLVSIVPAQGQEKETPQKPNIIWLMAEDIGLDLECYGMPAVKTPVLNKLADEGIKFTNCFCTNSICSPSRSAMMTGVHQNKINAHHHRSNRKVPLQSSVKPFTWHLREAGYTCVLGSELVMGKGRKIDVNFKHKAIGPWDGKTQFGLFDKVDKISPDDQPFFAQIQLVATHRGDWWDEVRSKSKHPVNPDSVVLPAFMADHPVIREDWAKYLDQMEYIDHEIGMIIQDLKDKGMYENTVIIFIGDNGRCNIRGKGYLFEPGLHIPLIVNWPKGIRSGQVNTSVTSTTDITATILDLAGVEAPEYLTGASFLRDDFSRDYVYSARDLWDEVMEKSRSLTTERFKYIRNDMHWTPYDAHQAYLEFYRPAVHIMRKLNFAGELNPEQKTFFELSKPKEQLFDLQSDPDELKNLADNPEYKEKLEELRMKLISAENQMTSVDQAFEPVIPKAVEILDWVKYTKTDEYIKMLNGVEIGFQKLAKEYKKNNK